MTDPDAFHRDQIKYWNGAGGERWVAQQAHTDAMLAPITERAIAHARVGLGERVIDVGCGCGATTIRLADRVGPHGHVLGLDVSGPMLAVARGRGAGRANITWLEDDAAAVPLPDGTADLLFSRFGVMFFGEPVSAFAHLRRTLRQNGRLVVACWRSLDENGWMKVPLIAAYQACAEGAAAGTRRARSLRLRRHRPGDRHPDGVRLCAAALHALRPRPRHRERRGP